MSTTSHSSIATATFPDCEDHSEGNHVPSVPEPVSGNIYSAPNQNSRSDALKRWVEGTTSLDSNGQTVVNDAGNGFTWNLYNHAFKLFVCLRPYIAEHGLRPIESDEKMLKEALGDLFLWGDGFGDGRLEMVIDESDDIKESVLESLTIVGSILIKFMPTCSEQMPKALREDANRVVEELLVLLDKVKLVIDSEHDSDDQTYSEDSTGIGIVAEMFKPLKSAVRCLMDLLPSMEATLAATKLPDTEEQASTAVEFKVSGPAQMYIRNVYDRFSQANQKLVERLGEANWQRHTALRFGQKFAEQEAPKSVFVPVSLFDDSGLGSSMPTKTSYAATMVSHSSFDSSFAGNENGGFRVPSLPKAVFRGEPFDCQICGRTLDQIKNRIDWKRHVFADIKPYICTFTGCADELKAFPTRKLWEDHEFKQHRQSEHWACTECSNKSTTINDFRSHLIDAHHIELSMKHFQMVSQKAERNEQHAIKDQQCPLCLVVPGKSRRHFVAHLGKHMEGIALAALPRDCSYDSETSSLDSKIGFSNLASEAVSGVRPPAVSKSLIESTTTKNKNPQSLITPMSMREDEEEGEEEEEEEEEIDNAYGDENNDEDDDDDDDREYEFDTLLDQRQKRNEHGKLIYDSRGEVVVQYKVKWVGTWAPTWEDQDNIPRDAVKDYTKRIPKTKKMQTSPREVSKFQRDIQKDELDDDENAMGPDEPRYCLCNQVSYGAMIGCDNDKCKDEWFHLGCVGLKDLPSRNTKWFCPKCRTRARIGDVGRDVLSSSLEPRLPLLVKEYTRGRRDALEELRLQTMTSLSPENILSPPSSPALQKEHQRSSDSEGESSGPMNQSSPKYVPQVSAMTKTIPKRINSGATASFSPGGEAAMPPDYWDIRRSALEGIETSMDMETQTKRGGSSPNSRPISLLERYYPIARDELLHDPEQPTASRSTSHREMSTEIHSSKREKHEMSLPRTPPPGRSRQPLHTRSFRRVSRRAADPEGRKTALDRQSRPSLRDLRRGTKASTKAIPTPDEMTDTATKRDIHAAAPKTPERVTQANVDDDPFQRSEYWDLP